jgi:hypothetical protein
MDKCESLERVQYRDLIEIVRELIFLRIRLKAGTSDEDIQKYKLIRAHFHTQQHQDDDRAVDRLTDLLTIVKEIIQLRARLITEQSDQDIGRHKILTEAFSEYLCMESSIGYSIEGKKYTI